MEGRENSSIGCSPLLLVELGLVCFSHSFPDKYEKELEEYKEEKEKE